MKKGFTLAEILIVLTIIGVMAVMTIPSLMQNANSQHKIAMFKKAFNAVSNAYATEFAVKTPPKKQSDYDYNLLFNAFSNQLNVKYYQNISTNEKVFVKPSGEDFDPGSWWIVTEDGISYSTSYRTSNVACISKLELNAIETNSSALASTCFHILIDIDGPNSGENTYCTDPNADLTKLNCDRIAIFVTSNGITAGNPDKIPAARILNND